VIWLQQALALVFLIFLTYQHLQRQKELEWENKQKDELLQRLMQQQQPKVEQTIAEPEDADEDYVPAGRVKGIARKAVEPLMQEINELKSKLAQQEQQKLIQNLRTQYSDFDDVVNVDTLEILEKQEPELAATISKLDKLLYVQLKFNIYRKFCLGEICIVLNTP